jgi:hypothetical protein
MSSVIYIMTSKHDFYVATNKIGTILAKVHDVRFHFA